jgi:hypothetical protein
MLQYQEDNELPVGERSWLHAHLTTGDVLLVVATPQMMDAACAGHDRPLFMDATHGTVKYGARPVLVMDQMNKGVPVAWAIVERERTVDEVPPGAQRRDPPQAADADKEWQPSCMLTDDVEAEHAATRCATHAVYCFTTGAQYGMRRASNFVAAPTAAMSGAGISHCAANSRDAQIRAAV